MTTTEILELAGRLGYAVVSQPDSHAIRVNVAPYSVEVVLPEAVFEWFVTVRDANGHELFSDWCDHYDAPDAELDAERTSAVGAFLRALEPGCLRVIEPEAGSARPSLEVRIDGSWVSVWDIGGT